MNELLNIDFPASLENASRGAGGGGGEWRGLKVVLENFHCVLFYFVRRSYV